MKKVAFYGVLGCVLLFWDIWGKRNDRVFRGSERGHSEIWLLARYHVSLGFGFKDLL